MRKRFTREEKAQHWSQWKSSGLNQKAYCERHDLNVNSFKNWGSYSSPKYPLVPVTITPLVPQPGFKIVLRQGVIELPRDTNEQEWRTLLAVLLESASC